MEAEATGRRSPAVGRQFGRYELLETLGAGGMGEVFRARDLVLLREVAIKLLPEPFTSSPGRLVRFTREARTASALNHPNILTVHDIGEFEGQHFMVTEIVKGLTLRQILRNERCLSVRRVLDLAIQIAEGLARAHAAGVVHRDLKPANLMVTPEGLVKILDFGLAKLHCPTVGEAPESEVSDLPTWPGGRWTDIAVSDGSLVGTVGYVSPEQVRGRPVDHRSDQFAFGATLYEMLTGQRAFRRETRGETLAAITDGEPAEMARLNPDIPAPVRWVVERCLAKDPEERYNSTSDLAQTLRGLREHLPELERAHATVAAGTARRLRLLQGRLRPIPGQVATIAAALALVVLGFVRGDNAPWSRSLGQIAGEPPVSIQSTGSSGPGMEDAFRDDPFLEVMTFRWTRRPPDSPGTGAEPIVLEGRVERRLDWVRITARVVNASGSRGPRQVELSRGELLAIASAMAEVLDDRGATAESPDVELVVGPGVGDAALLSE